MTNSITLTDATIDAIVKAVADRMEKRIEALEDRMKKRIETLEDKTGGRINHVRGYADLINDNFVKVLA